MYFYKLLKFMTLLNAKAIGIYLYIFASNGDWGENEKTIQQMAYQLEELENQVICLCIKVLTYNDLKTYTRCNIRKI
mgnify:CR=1 FL=1